MRGSDDCFAQIAGTYLNEERTGGGAPPVEGYSRRRVCCTYRVSDRLYHGLFADLADDFVSARTRREIDGWKLGVLAVRVDGEMSCFKRVEISSPRPDVDIFHAGHKIFASLFQYIREILCKKKMDEIKGFS